MAKIHGSKAVVMVDDAGGVAVDFSAYIKKVTFPRSAETADVSTLGSGSKQRIGGLKDAKVTIEGPWDAVAEAQLSAILGLVGTVTYRPEGTAAGKRFMQGEMILTSYEPSSDVGDADSYKAEFELATGDVTVGVQ